METSKMTKALSEAHQEIAALRAEVERLKKLDGTNQKLMDECEAELHAARTENESMRDTMERSNRMHAIALERTEAAEAKLAECHGYLPIDPGDALAFDGTNLTPHVVRVADEYAILREQRDAACRELAALREAAGALVTFAEDHSHLLQAEIVASVPAIVIPASLVNALRAALARANGEEGA